MMQRSPSATPTSSSCSVSDLSGGKIAGIVIPVVVAVISAFVAGVYCARFFKRRRDPDPPQSDEDDTDIGPNPPARRVTSPKVTADEVEPPDWTKDTSSGGL